MVVLVTGSAGFIGSALCLRLLDRGDTVLGVDNHNDYYDQSLKEARLARHLQHPNYKHFRLDLADRSGVEELFAQHRPNCVVNLAAQAGVRYSIDNPLAYIDSNILGFAHVLEGCRQGGVEHLVYASSSSVYGANKTMPFSVHHNVDHPLSLYAASKKSNELMAHTYSHLYGLPTTGLRFFTVYGPWGRPDMAPFKFANAILSGDTLNVYNYGNHRRDFTYVDDVVEGLIRVLDHPAEPDTLWSAHNPSPASSNAPWRLYNIGGNRLTELTEFIETLEKELGRTARKEFLPIQPGDVPDTYADVSDLVKAFNYQPGTLVSDGVRRFADWYLKFYGYERGVVGISDR